MADRLISEVLRPVEGGGFLGAPRVGEPAVPCRFAWRQRVLVLSEMLDQWKESGPCRSGGGERYVRKHWFRARTSEGTVLTFYFERQPGRNPKRRWWLYTVADDQGNDPCAIT